MNLKKKMKKLFTFARRDGGFTLVELVVVIAILGVLGGVGVPAYSGYVKKANMQADMSLAREIENALTLAHYNRTIPVGATVIVYYDEAKDVITPAVLDSEGNEIDNASAALIAAFGDSYTDLRLKYNGWGEELGVIADGAAYENVQQSMFKGDNLGYMLEDVQLLTGLVADALTNQTANITNPEFEAYMDSLGLDKNNYQVVSNATTMYVADKIAAVVNKAPADGQTSNKDLLMQAWCDGDLSIDSFRDHLGNYNAGTGGYDTSLQSSAMGYARAEALANYLDKQLAAQGLTGTYAESLRAASTGVDPDAMIMGGLEDLIVALEDVYGNGSTDPLKVATANAFASYFAAAPNCDSQAQKDAQAFLSYMDGVQTSTDSLVKDTDLTVDNYYTDGNILSYVTSYLDIGKALADAGYTGDGAFAFVYTGVSTDPVKCAPLDY